MSSSDRRPEIFGLALGLYATLAQVTLMREALTVAGGNELAVGLGFAAWLACVAIGAMAAAPLPRPLPAALVACAGAGPLSGAGLLILRGHRAVLDLSAAAEPTIGQLTALLSVGLGIGGLTVGFAFTATARSLAGKAPAPVSRLYTFEALGALAGGLLFTFAVAGRLAPLVALGIVSALLTGAGAVLPASRAGRSILGIAAGLLLATSILLLPAIDRDTQREAFERLGSGELVATTESAYGRLSLGRSQGQYQLLADGRIDHAFPDPWERTPGIHMALTQHPGPKRVLLIGGGAPDVLRAALSHHPDRVVLTYLDEAVHELCRPFWPASTKQAVKDERVVVVHDDGRRFVARTEQRFDVVVVTARAPLSGQANRYHTVEFYRAVSEILAPGGAMTAFAPGGANVLAPEAARAAASTLATARAVFPHVILIPGLRTGVHAAVETGVVVDDADALERRFAERDVEARGFSARRFGPALERSRIAALQNQLSRWPAAINTDARPRAYLANLQLWERSLSSSGAADDPTWTGAAERWAWVWLVAPLLLWALWRGARLIRRRNEPASDAVFSIATTGATGMAAEIVVLYAFQSASGRLYTGLALLVGLFMAGLAVGAYLGRRLLAIRPRRGGLVADAAALLLMLVTGPLVLHTFDQPLLIGTWSGFAGVVTGAAFPALLAVCAERRAGDERLAVARIEAADHLGAAVGALVTAVIWLPVYGVVATCLLFAALKGASLAGLLPSVVGRGRNRRRPLNS